MARFRLVELPLLALPCAIAAGGLAAIAVARGGSGLAAIGPAYALAGLCLVAHAVLAWRRPTADQLLLPLVAVLCSLGLFVVARTQPGLVGRQMIYLGIGVGLFVAVMVTDEVFTWLARYRYTLALAGAGILAFTLVFGVDPNQSGVRIWVGVGDNLFQPSEVVKVMMVAFLAAYLDDKRELLALGSTRLGSLRLPPLPYLLPSLVMLGLCLLLFLVQHDLGVTFLFFGVFIAMLYATSGRGVFVVGGFAALIGASFLVYRLFSVARIRFDVWLNPWADAQGKGFQIVQALVAFANGGVLGTGPGYGSPGLIPASFTDFPFAVIGEELGMLGTIAVVAIYLVFTIRGYRIALDLGDSFRGLLTLGLTTTVGLQALIIMAGNLKLIPLTGITLPFVSYGGSSLLTNWVILALLLRLSADVVPPEPAASSPAVKAEGRAGR